VEELLDVSNPTAKIIEPHLHIVEAVFERPSCCSVEDAISLFSSFGPEVYYLKVVSY
jgi:hypothetical protein